MRMDALAGEGPEDPAAVRPGAGDELVERDPKVRESRRLFGDETGWDRVVIRRAGERNAACERQRDDGERGAPPPSPRAHRRRAQRYTGLRFSKKDAIASRPSGATRRHRHHLGGVGVRVRLVEVDLGVERVLAGRLGGGAAAARGVRELFGLRAKLGGWHDAVHQSPVRRRPRVDRVAGQQHLERALPADRRGSPPPSACCRTSRRVRPGSRSSPARTRPRGRTSRPAGTRRRSRCPAPTPRPAAAPTARASSSRRSARRARGSLARSRSTMSP